MLPRTFFARAARENPLADALEIRKEMSRLFDTWAGRPGPAARPTAERWMPPLDVYDADDALEIHAELPGIRQEEIEISIRDNILTIRGERKPDPGVEGGSYHRRERFTGPFQRTLTLPSVVDTAQVKATYRDGVVEIRLPKKEEVRPRTIRVEAA